MNVPAGRLTMRCLCVLLTLTFGLAHPCLAQVVVRDHQDLDFQRPEAWAMAYMGAATLFLSSAVPRHTEAGAVRLGAEFSLIPHIDHADTKVGFNGTKFEDLNKSPLFGRLRLLIGLPWDFALELGWTPPLEIDGAQPDGIYALALQRPLLQNPPWRVGLRAYAQAAHIEGDITCPEEVARIEPGRDGNLFGCRAPSDDDVELDTYGVAMSVSYAFEHDLEVFAAVAITRLDGFVQINAPVFSAIDRSTRATEGTLKTARLGLTFVPSPRWEWTVAGDYTPLKVRRPPTFSEQTDPFWSLRVSAAYSF